MKANQRRSPHQMPINQARWLGFAAALMLDACDQGKPPKEPAGIEGTALEAQPSLIDRAMRYTEDATRTITEKATASANGAAGQAPGTATDKRDGRLLIRPCSGG